MHPDHISIAINLHKLSSVLGLPEAGPTGTETIVSVIHLPLRLKRRGVEARLVVGGDAEPVSNPDTALIALIAKAHRWCDQMTDGSTASITELAVRENEDRNEISRHLPLAFLAPDIVEKILKGIQPVDLTAEKLRRLGSLPYRWDEQRAVLGFTADPIPEARSRNSSAGPLPDASRPIRQSPVQTSGGRKGPPETNRQIAGNGAAAGVSRPVLRADRPAKPRKCRWNSGRPLVETRKWETAWWCWQSTANLSLFSNSLFSAN